MPTQFFPAQFRSEIPYEWNIANLTYVGGNLTKVEYYFGANKVFTIDNTYNVDNTIATITKTRNA